MTAADRSERLWELLPVDLRAEDLSRGGALRALLAIISQSVNAVEDDVRDLYDDLFIETCEPWVVPYIAELISSDVVADGSRGDALTAESLFTDLVGRDLRPALGARMRADVARTIHYRRRKGTLAVLEELARNVTGWPVRALEGIDVLGWNQHLEHLRPRNALADIRSPERCERAGGAFDDFAHTIDVRPLRPFEGWPNVRKVALYTWRLRSDPIVWATARASATCPFGWTFSPLGQPAPLFAAARRDPEDDTPTTELQVPEAMRRTLFAADLRAFAASAPPRAQATQYYGEFSAVGASGLALAPEASFAVYRGGVGVGPAVDPDAPAATFGPGVVCRRLDPWPTTQPAGAVVLVDVVAGRLVLGRGFAAPAAGAGAPVVTVSYHAGSAAALGGGSYSRRPWLLPEEGDVERRFVASRPGAAAPATATSSHGSVKAALTAWAAAGSNPCVIEILDSGTYPLPGGVTLPADGRLALEAADRERPVLQTPASGFAVGVNASPADRGVEATLTLAGVVVEGHLEITGPLRRLRLWHTTLVPGRRLTEDGSPPPALPSVVADPIQTLRLRIEAAFSILGPVTAPSVADGVWLLDSILDSVAGDDASALRGPTTGDLGPRLVTERSTVIGRVAVIALDASECILTGDAKVERTQEGCVRFSYVTAASVTPRRFRCQPELAATAVVEAALERDPTLAAPARQALRAGVASRIVPSFTDRRYGQPAYGQLRRGTPLEITTGAEDGSEMGALCHLKQAQRESNLRLRLSEYLPFGLEAGPVYVS